MVFVVAKVVPSQPDHAQRAPVWSSGYHIVAGQPGAEPSPLNENFFLLRFGPVDPLFQHGHVESALRSQGDFNEVERDLPLLALFNALTRHVKTTQNESIDDAFRRVVLTLDVNLDALGHSPQGFDVKPGSQVTWSFGDVNGEIMTWKAPLKRDGESHRWHALTTMNELELSLAELKSEAQQHGCYFEATIDCSFSHTHNGQINSEHKDVKLRLLFRPGQQRRH